MPVTSKYSDSMSAKHERQETSCSIRDSHKPPRSYEEVVQRYIANFRRNASTEMRWFATRSDFQTALELAALCRSPANKRHDHQRRIPQRILKKALTRLKKCDLESSASFEELHDRVDDAIGSIHGAGKLTVYDIAHRIGAYLKLAPEKVYLHRGTKMGAQAMGLGRGCKTLEVSELPKPFRKLKPSEIEDCLCIYKKALAKIGA